MAVRDNSNNNSEWVSLGGSKGAVKVALPNKYNEILVKCNTGGDVIILLHIPKITLDTVPQAFSNSQYVNSTSYRTVSYTVTTNDIELNRVLVDGVDKTNEIFWAVFYR